MMPPNTASDAFRILLVSNYEPDKQRSMQRYAALLYDGLNKAGADVELYHPPVLFGKLGARPTGLGKWIGYIDKYLLFPLLLRRKIRSIDKPHIVHICDHSNAIYSSSLDRIPHLVTCHDLLAVRAAKGEFASHTVGWTGRIQQRWILSGLKRSNCIVCVSNATSGDLTACIGNQLNAIHTIPNALDPSFYEDAPDSKELPPPLHEGSNYVLHVGSDAWYKNRSAALQIYEQLAKADSSLEFIVVGPPFSQTDLSKLQDVKTGKRIHYLSDLSDNALRAVYRHSKMLLFPSVLEGFGWPIIEAQACGCPVATLDRPPMNELNASQSLKLPAPETTQNWAEASAKICAATLNLDLGSQKLERSRLKHFCKQFELVTISQSYLVLYHSLVMQKRPRNEATPRHPHN